MRKANSNSKRYEVLAEIRKYPRASIRELMERVYLHSTSAISHHLMKAVLVRLPINDVTRPMMKQSNCMTPMAQVSGLWVFDEGEFK